MKITKSIEVNETILTIYNFINIMYYNSCDNLPSEISKDIEILLMKLTEYMERDFLDLDIVEDKLIREISFIDKK